MCFQFCAWRRIVDPAGLWSAHIVCMQLVLRACVVNHCLEQLSRFTDHDNRSIPLRWTQLVAIKIARYAHDAVNDA